MCEGLLDLKDAIDLISGLPGGPPRLSALDWWVIEVGREILNPFMLAQVMLEGEKYVTGSLVIPMVESLRKGLLEAQTRVQELSAAVGDQKLDDGTDFDMGSILDAMVDDFETRWGDGTNLLEFKYGQSGTGVGQPCGYTSEQIIQFAVDPRMVVLPHIPEEREDEIWDSVKTALTELIEQDLGKAGKGKQVVEGGVDQGPSGGGGGAVRSGVEHFGGGKRAKVGLAAIPECQDSALLARQVRIVSVDVCGF